MTALRGQPKLQAAVLLVVTMCVGFSALGVWQLQRRIWKLALIDRVEQRLQEPPVPAPGPNQWSLLGRTADEYRRVQVTGIFRSTPPTLVQAVTERGAGFWVLTPMQRDDGSTVLINRGFVMPGWHGPASASTQRETVIGLLRFSEPHGGFLRANDPARNRWTSRDVQAIAAAQGLHRTAPYFIDAQSPPSDGQAPDPRAPVAGLTVVRFSNNHLVYAITWFTLALMAAAAGWRLVRECRQPLPVR